MSTTANAMLDHGPAAPRVYTTATGELFDRELILRYMAAASFWLVFAPSVGAIVALKFNFYDFLGHISWLTWGRLRPVHVMGVVFGGFSTAVIGLTYYIVPRLCGVPMYKERWGHHIFWMWNIGLAVGFVSLALGYNSGIEAGEFPLWVSIPVEIVLCMLTIQVLGTVKNRTEQRLYVTLWYLTAAYIWTALNYAFGHFILPYSMPGVNNAAMHGLYIHYVVGLWITPAGLAVAYYFLPLAAKRPLYSHKLSLVGFWALAFFYPFVGTHHYIYSPIPYWTQTIAIVASMMLIIPVWTVVANFYGTFVGAWKQFQESFPAKFIIIGALYYFVGCFQGSTEALREMQRLTHFTDFVIGHSHLTVFGTFVIWATAGMYWVTPRLAGRELYSKNFAQWHYWLTVVGFSIMAFDLTIQGLMQGTMLQAGADFVDSMSAMKPYWFVRSLAGITMDIGAALGFWNLYMTIKHGKLIPVPPGVPVNYLPEPKWS
jgi:cbb3-type cytochrome c oxidase subunit I